ncbi:hypothetical protein MACH24_27470 [Erythrobacter sp. Dej080120_24]|nr:hypothetical protein MACH24_27470 [Erythrobacter sp. Dej080120_24]
MEFDNLTGMGFAITEKNSVTVNEDGCEIDIVFRGSLQNVVVSTIEGDKLFGPIKPIKFDLDGYTFVSERPRDDGRTFFEVEKINVLNISDDDQAIDMMAVEIFGTVDGIRRIK